MQCRKCRAEMPDGGKFCPYCGTRQDRELRKSLKRANGTGTVYKLQGRRRRPWIASKSKTIIIGYYETKTAALEALNRLSGRSLDERYNMTFVLMLIYTGMRIGELFSLPLEDYHKTYVVGGEKTAAGRNRVIPIRPEGRGYFAYFAAQADGPLLLSGYIGQKVPNNFRNRDYYPLLKKLGIEKKTPHATRHTYASRARRAGMQPEILQKILGHADYNTTANIYVHTDIEELVKAVEGA